jgi:ElaB/YqjD/DUF883 family membrane-anchored ribosome-binding protein
MKMTEANKRLTNDLKQVTRDAEDLLKATAGQAGDKVKEIRGRLSDALDSAKASCEKLQDQAADAARATDRVIRRRPYESIGVAFGLGLLIGILVSRD